MDLAFVYLLLALVGFGALAYFLPPWADLRRGKARVKRKEPILPPHLQDAKAWLRAENKRAQREWDLEFLALSNGENALRSHTARVALIQRWLRDEGVYSGACDGQSNMYETERAMRRALEHYGTRPLDIPLANGRGRLILRGDGTNALEMDGVKVELVVDRTQHHTYLVDTSTPQKRGTNYGRPRIEDVHYTIHGDDGRARYYGIGGELIYVEDARD